MHKYSEKGRSLETETSSVLLEFEDTTFYARVSRAKCCIVTICSVVTMILASVSYHLLTSDVALVQQTFQNWELAPLEDITVVTSGHICPSGYETAWTGAKWKGTSSGCYCPYNFFDKLTSGYCTRKKNRSFCDSVSSKSPIYYENFDEYIVCVKRAQLPPIMQAPTTTNDGDCDFGYKPCGARSSNAGERMCVEDSQKCPINSVAIGTDSEVSGYEKTVTISGDKKLGFSTNATGLPVVQFKISEGYPCIDMRDENYGNKKYHELEYRKSGCDKFGNYRYDTRWVGIANITEYSLYNSNGVIQALASLPESDTSPQSHSNLYTLYYRRYINWDPHCSANGKHISRSKIASDSRNMSESIKSYQVGIVVVSVFFVVFGIITLVIACCRKCAPFSQIFILIIKCVVIVFCGIMFALYLRANLVIQENEKPFNEIMTTGCSDRQTDETLGELPEQIQSTKTTNWVGFYFNLFLVLWEVIIYVYSWCKHGKPI